MKISLEQEKQLKRFFGWVTGLVLLCSAGYGISQVIRCNQARPLTYHKFDLSPVRYVSDLSHSIGDIQAKVVRIRKSAEENERLRLENMNLRVKLESLQYSHNAKAADKNTKEFELKLSKETGAKVGRSLSSINYQVPAKLFASQLYTLALAYVVAREDEKAVVLLTHLTGQEENGLYKNAKDYLLTGVAWFRIENFALADYYFDEVLKIPESETSIQQHAQARLWKGIVAEKLQKKFKAQFWLKELVDHHPNSQEAKWVNLAQGAPETQKLETEKHEPENH